LTQPGIDFVVCDAGGSTIDTTIYTVSSVTPSLALREKRDSACQSDKCSSCDILTKSLIALGIQAGGIFVDQSATAYFEQKLYDSDLDPDQVSGYLGTATEKFITEIKPSFKDTIDDHLLAVADRQFSNVKAGIERGYMTLTGWVFHASQIQIPCLIYLRCHSVEVEPFFKQWVDQIIASIRDQIGSHPVKVCCLF
jgi:hypothetical protein